MSLECHLSVAIPEIDARGSPGTIFPYFCDEIIDSPLMVSSGKRAIILLNLGSPDSTATRDVHRYLMEFLMDKRVIDYPWLFRKILVGGIIVPFRAAKSAEAYETIWTKDGSPLIVLTRRLQEALGGNWIFR